jgi:hypothetical protein
MKWIEGKVTILCSEDKVTIEFHDEDSNTTFAKATMNPEAFTAAIGRLYYVDADIEVRGLDRVGKVHETAQHEFEIGEGVGKDPVVLYGIAKATAPEGWTPDNYFGSQGSFFTRDGKRYARCTIRRWVEK